MKRHQDKHQRRSIRLKEYDYTQPGAYYVTIRAWKWKCIFGKIIDDKMILNHRGEVVQQCWFSIPKHDSNVDLDLFIVMPNHVHGIIWLKEHRMGTACRAHTPGISAKPRMQFGKPITGSLPTIIRSFKSAVTKQIRKGTETRRYFVWNRGYYEHVIRNDTELSFIRDYILNNPLKWILDRDNPERRKKTSRSEQKVK